MKKLLCNLSLLGLLWSCGPSASAPPAEREKAAGESSEATGLEPVDEAGRAPDSSRQRAIPVDSLRQSPSQHRAPGQEAIDSLKQHKGRKKKRGG